MRKIFFRRGQTVVFILLLGLLGTAIAMAAASRSISDIKQVSFTDAGTRALAAADTGLEYVLSQKTPGPQVNCPGPALITGLSLANIASLNYQFCWNSLDAVSNPSVNPDDVFQVDVSQNLNTSVSSFDVLWNNNNAAVEISVVDFNSTNNSYALRRYAYNGTSLTANNQFGSGVPCSSVNLPDPQNICSAPGFSGSSSCSPVVGGVGAIPLANGNYKASLLRIKPLSYTHASSGIELCGRGASGTQPLSLQYAIATTSATANNGAVRRVQTVVIPPALPSVFDNAIFSGGDLVK